VVQNGTRLDAELLGPHHLLKRIAVSPSNCDTWYARVHTYRSCSQGKILYAGSTEPMHAPLARLERHVPLCVMYRQRTGRWPSVHKTCPYSFRHHSNLFVVMPTTCVRFCRARQEFLTTHLHPYSRTDVLLHQDVPTDQCPDTARLDARLTHGHGRGSHMMMGWKDISHHRYVSLSLTTPTLRGEAHSLSMVLPEGLEAVGLFACCELAPCSGACASPRRR
jgi:hypothetical protein